jgi:hypothetical protein
MRNMLQDLAAQQQAAREAKKAEKRAKKQAAAAGATFSPPKPSISPVGDFIDLSSPAKPRDTQLKSSPVVQDTEQLEVTTSETAKPQSRQASPTEAVPVSEDQADDEMLFRPNQAQVSSPSRKSDLQARLEIFNQ